MANKVTYKAKDVGSSLYEVLKNNIIPTAMIGVGIAWLGKNVSDGGGEIEEVSDIDYFYDPYTRRAGEAPSGVKGRARQKTRSARYKTGEMMDRARERARTAGEKTSEWMDRAREKTTRSTDQISSHSRELSSRARSEYRRMMDDNPFVIAGALFAVGAALGFLFPQTGKEEEWMGEKRDEFMERAKEKGRETMEEAQDVARKAGKSATETAKEEAEKKGFVSETKAEEEKPEKEFT